jgi:hypothetical protein
MISRSKRSHRQLGFALADTLVITACFAIGAGSAAPNLADRVEQIPIEASQDIACLEAAIVRFASRSMIEQRTYHELPIINGHYDLQSKGRDGHRDPMPAPTRGTGEVGLKPSVPTE